MVLYRMLNKSIHKLILFLSIVPVLILPTTAFASTNITISHNGEHSNNNASYSSSNIVTTFQSNVSTIVNTVFNFSNTGGNNANGTKGKGKITTGNAASNVTINNSGNSNIISVPEFSPLQAILITLVSSTVFILMRKRFA
jgi:hypothetical protein